MTKASVVICDPPWNFADTLSMSSVKRGAAANYKTMSIDDIISLPIKDIADPNGCVLALWVPSSLLAEGLRVMNAYGFTCKQTYIWVKSKKPTSLQSIVKKDISNLLDKIKRKDIRLDGKFFSLKDMAFDVGDWLLGIGLGRLFRQSHEICLIGINNTKIYSKLQDKSQRSVCFAANTKHSAKPENLQNSLDLMFPDNDLVKLEVFARRQRPGYYCLGNETSMTMGEDIRISLDKFKRMTKSDADRMKVMLDECDFNALKTKWEML